MVVLKGVLDADERRYLVPQAVVVDVEQQIEVDQKTLDHVELEPYGSTQGVEGVFLEGQCLESGFPIKCLESTVQAAS